MRERITYIHNPEDDYEPKNIQVQQDSLGIKALKAAKEDRLTAGVHEVPQEESFIKLPVLSERFATSASFQYYQSLLGLEDLITYISQKICPSLGEQCHRKASSLRGANYVDLDFDTISQALDVRAFYSRPTDGISASESWTEQITRPNKDSRVEVGILATEKSTEPESLTFGGFLTVIGEDAKPTSKNLRSIRAVYGETDLEAPVYATKKWGSAMLIELAPPLPSPRSSAKQDSGIWHADIPLHLRYLPPINITSSSSSEDKQGISPAEVPWPVVFWACTAEEGTKMNVNPFDRVSLGYDGLFGPRTMFYHFKPRIPPMIKVVGEMDMEMGLGRGGELVERIDVPVLMIGEGREWWIEMGTVLVVVAGFLWITWKVVGSVMLGDKKTADRNGEKKSQ
ncbi:protease B nonderepressible form [Agyrium rufum]|nr:protease B nonderepressible form [Agyrium rufum]